MCYINLKIIRYYKVCDSFLAKLQQLTVDLDVLDSYLQFHLLIEVKKRLPQVLQQKGETTFAQQIRTLAEALQASRGSVSPVLCMRVIH